MNVLNFNFILDHLRLLEDAFATFRHEPDGAVASSGCPIEWLTIRLCQHSLCLLPAGNGLHTQQVSAIVHGESERAQRLLQILLWCEPALGEIINIDKADLKALLPTVLMKICIVLIAETKKPYNGIVWIPSASALATVHQIYSSWLVMDRSLQQVLENERLQDLGRQLLDVCAKINQRPKQGPAPSGIDLCSCGARRVSMHCWACGLERC
jgi:hypothetical protein